MPISLTITADTPDQLHAQLAAILQGSRPVLAPSGDGVALTTTTHPEPAKRTGRPPKATTEATADTKPDESHTTEAGAAPAGAEASTPDETQFEVDNALTYDKDIKPAILKVSAHPIDQGGGREGVTGLLKAFGVDHASKLTPAQWSDVLAAVAAIVGEDA